MAVSQKIIPIRRDYNRWVANQTLEDYALRFTATSARRWSNFRVANTALGAISFLALEAIGGAITLNYGFINAFWAIVSISVLIFVTGLPISYFAAKYGVDMDLLTRGAGFGYIGSTITSLLYASFTFIFFAIEAAIMAHALKICLGMPLGVGYVISALAVIPLVTHGITLISRFQVWTQPVWLVLHLLPFVFIAIESPATFAQWTSFSGHQGDGSFSIVLYGAAASVAMALVVQIGEQVDFLRFLKRPQTHTSTAWKIALVCAGPGWIVPGMLKLLAGSFLVFLALQHQVPAQDAAEPTQMYLTAFGYVFDSPSVALAATGLFVVISQLKINVTNAYAGSIAWSNFFARLTQSHPGRVVWVVFHVVTALLLIELGIFKALETILGLYANVAIAWIGALVADLVVNKPLGLSPPSIEFKRAHLYDVNPVGIGAMSIAALVSLAAFGGMFGELLKALCAFVAFAVAFLAAPAIALATRGKYYLARQPQDDWHGAAKLQCRVCEHTFEPQDVAHCPAYSGPICSLCCSLDARCNDICKDDSPLHGRLGGLLRNFLPPPVIHVIDSQLGLYLVRFVLSIAMIAAVLGIVYVQETVSGDVDDVILQGPLFKVFMIFILIAGVTSWLSVLATQSRRVAQEESSRQNQLLRQEVEAHRQTDGQLKRAKEVAEAANLAKSRYISGVSHELRTPLNAILGYAQLLSQDSAIPLSKRTALQVMKRSAEHLSVLIDGLLDMARIEAGKLVLRRDPVPLDAFIVQLVEMFDLQAKAKGLQLRLEISRPLPQFVQTDEKRLRQILINLLSNAIKYTDAGSVIFRISYRRPLAEFEVKDTGVGIPPEELKRIFEPFERGSSATGVPGTGLGLTISNLLAQVMGGDLTVTSVLGQGSAFRVRILLTASDGKMALPGPQMRITGYLGGRRRIMVVDDDPAHRMLMRDILVPLGFTLQETVGGADCLEHLVEFRPDLLLLDISMSSMDGWDVVRHVRVQFGISLPIIIVSANAIESLQPRDLAARDCDFLVKPVVLAHLFDLLRRRLDLNWTTESADEGDMRKHDAPAKGLGVAQIDELISLGRIGYVRGIEAKLESLSRVAPAAATLLAELGEDVRTFQFKHYLDLLESLRQHEK